MKRLTTAPCPFADSISWPLLYPILPPQSDGVPEEDVKLFCCWEEPYMIPYATASGYIPLFAGQSIKPVGGSQVDLIVRRKLGWGIGGSVWLVESEHGFSALKVLHRSDTVLSLNGSKYEIETLRRLSADRIHDPPDLFDDHCCVHAVSGTTLESKHGQHCAIMLTLYAGNLHDVVQSMMKKDPQFRLELPDIKRIAHQILEAVEHLHALGIVHTDLKITNLFVRRNIENPEMHVAITEFLGNHPPTFYPSGTELTFSPDPIIPPRSEPLPPQCLEVSSPDVIDVCVGDYSEAVPFEKISEMVGSRDIMAINMRAPEIVLGMSWGPAIDIWAVGVIVFELLTWETALDGRTMDLGLTEEQIQLIRIQELCGKFPSILTTKLPPDSHQYFTKGGHLRKQMPQRLPMYGGLRKRLAGPTSKAHDDFTRTLQFLERCLCLDPSQRPSAADLLDDEWFSDE